MLCLARSLEGETANSLISLKRTVQQVVLLCTVRIVGLRAIQPAILTDRTRRSRRSVLVANCGRNGLSSTVASNDINDLARSCLDLRIETQLGRINGSHLRDRDLECQRRLEEIEAAGELAGREPLFIMTGVKRSESFGRGWSTASDPKSERASVAGWVG